MIGAKAGGASAEGANLNDGGWKVGSFNQAVQCDRVMNISEPET